MDPHNNSALDDTSWLAYGYAANELSSPERERFEERLLDDQQAREAVASAVELHAALLASRKSVGSHRRPTPFWSLAAQAVACSAAALLICLFLPTPRPLGSAHSDLEPAVSQDLAVLWASQLEEPLDDEPELIIWNDPETAVAIETTPEWMFAAVGSELGGDDIIEDGSSGTEEPL